MKILHITEALGAGVEHYIALVVQGQLKAGHQVVLAHSIRPETSVDQFDKEFAGLSKRVVVPMVTQVSPLKDAMSVWYLMQLLRQEQPDVVHLHSSKAGVLGRVAVLLSASRARVFYSPHGFAFLRQDVSAMKRALFLWFEQIAGRLKGTLVACSATEAELAVHKVRHTCVRLVENAIDLSQVQHTTGAANGAVRVMNAGRACYQKAPWRFRAVAQQCIGMPAQFVWVGDGEHAHELRDTGITQMHMTGWASRAQVAAQMAQADIFLMPSLWEGMPLALIEAQAAGVPAVVSNVVGCRDVVQDGVTGFVCDTDDELCKRTQQLIEDAELRKRLGDNALQMAQTRFAVGRLNDELLSLYAGK